MIDFLNEARELLPVISEVRKQIHRHPELGNQEFYTSSLIQKTLESHGIEVHRILDTGLVGDICGNGEITAAVRSDIDALPVSEQTGCEFASEITGCMHACGHDVHAAALIGSAIILKNHQNELAGNVRLFFQPDEEGSGGAVRMIEQGCMDGVSAVFGGHVVPELPLGQIGVHYGKFYAASDTFRVTVRGKSCHGATPSKGIDALKCAAQMIASLKHISVDPKEYVLSVGTFTSGTAINVIADEAVFTGIIRTLGPVNRARVKEEFRQIVQKTAEMFGASVEINIRESYAGVVNTDAETSCAQRAFEQALGRANVVEIPEPTFTTEDFGYFIEAAAGTFYHIGAGCTEPLHSPEYLPQEEALVYAMAAHAAVVFEYLRNHE